MTYSQTLSPYHHDYGGQYIFEPRLESGISASVLAELTAANVAYLVVIDDEAPTVPAFGIGGLDGTLRPL